MHMKNRFMKLYRIYRKKKFNEPYDMQKTGNADDSDDGYDFNPKKYIPKPMIEQEDMIYKKIAELNKALNPQKPKVDDCAISDLHTVNEDYDDENDDDMDATDPNLNPQAFVRSKREYEEHVAKYVETSVIIDEIKEYIKKVNKVKRFLVMAIYRNRFLKRRADIRMLQRYMKGYAAWRDSRIDLILHRDILKVGDLESIIIMSSDVERDRLD